MGIFSPIKRKVFSKIHCVCVGVCNLSNHKMANRMNLEFVSKIKISVRDGWVLCASRCDTERCNVIYFSPKEGMFY